MPARKLDLNLTFLVHNFMKYFKNFPCHLSNIKLKIKAIIKKIVVDTKVGHVISEISFRAKLQTD